MSGRTWSHPIISPDHLPSSHPKNIAQQPLQEEVSANFCWALAAPTAEIQFRVQASNCGASMLSFWSTNFFRTWWMRIFDWKISMHSKVFLHSNIRGWNCWLDLHGIEMVQRLQDVKNLCSVQTCSRNALIPTNEHSLTVADNLDWGIPHVQRICKSDAAVDVANSPICDDSWCQRQHSWPLLPASWEIRFDGPLFRWQHPVHSAGSSCTMQMFWYWWQITWHTFRHFGTCYIPWSWNFQVGYDAYSIVPST